MFYQRFSCGNPDAAQPHPDSASTGPEEAAPTGLQERRLLPVQADQKHTEPRVWKGLQSITGFKKRTPPVETPRLAKQILLQRPRPHSKSARRKCARCSGDKRSGRHRAQTACHLPA
ncbi:uncharacterized protein ACBT44_006672 isoform 2-T3 [Syngnathus typhle]